MTTILIIILTCLFVLSFSASRSKKKTAIKTNYSPQNIPHATNVLYDDTGVNIVGIDDPILKLTNTSQISDITTPSFSDQHQTYTVSISSMTCTCLDFTETRVEFNTNDPRRGCKHIVERLAENDLLKQQDELSLAILLSPARGDLATFKTESGMVFSLIFEKKGWVSVFMRRRRKGEKGFFFTGKYQQYGYNLNDNRWSYGDAPPGSKYLKNAIRQTLPYFDK